MIAAVARIALAASLALATGAVYAQVYNAYGAVSTIYPTPDGKLLFQLKNTTGSSCTVNSPYYFLLTAADGRVVDRWFTVLATSYATGRRVWIQGDSAQCVANQNVPGYYILNIDW